MIFPLDSRLALFGRSNFRGDRRVFGIKQADRRAHMYVVGKTGTGKSTLLETLIRQDLGAPNGLALLDPHGDLAGRVIPRVPASRWDDLVLFDVPDPKSPITFNPLAKVEPDKQPVAAAAMLEVMRKLWPTFWGPRMEHLLRNAFLALMERPEAVLKDVLQLLDDDGFRKEVASGLRNVQVREFWLSEYAEYPKRMRAEAISPIQSKIGAFLADPVLYRIFSSPTSSFDPREILDHGAVLVVNLSKGRLGGDSASLLGSLLVSRLGIAALGRAEVPEQDRRDFFMFLDEFQSYTTLSLASMLSELRKYRLGMVLAHQYLAQLDPQIREAVFGNVGTLVAFRVGSEDARILERDVAPEFAALDLMRVPNHHFFVKLMVDGAPTSPFTGETIEPYG